MDETRNRYILLQDRVGIILERNMFGLSTKSTPTQVLKGELLEALPEDEQPNEGTRIALAGIDRKSLRLECRTEDIARLMSEDASLLLAISSAGLRYESYIDRNRLDFGRRILPGNQVFVEVKGISKKLHGTVWYKGDLPPNLGTMFGVELFKNPGLGTSDGMFRNKRYFTCPADSGVFVGLDKLTPLENSDLKSPPKSPKRDENSQPNFVSRFKDVVPSFLKGKNDQRLPWKRTDYKLKIDQRVVTFADDAPDPIRGTVRYIGEDKQSDGQVHTIVGLELDKRCGSGTGKLKGKQVFVAKRDYAAFVDIEAVIPEKDFDENTGEAATSRNEDPVSEQIHKDEILARSMSYDHGRPSGDESVKKVRRTSSVDSADHDVIMAAGESSKTDHTAFIEQQQKMLHEFKSSKDSASKDSDVEMGSEEKTDSASNLNFRENHFRNTPPDSALRKNSPITRQPGLPDVGTTTWYSDYVHIEKGECEKLVQQRENDRRDHARPLAAEVESDNHSSVASNKPESGASSKVPAEQLEHEKTLLHTDEQASDKITDLEVQTSGDIPHGLEVGSMVEVPMAQGLPRYGVIKWIGSLPSLKDKLVAGLELEDEQSACSDGTFNGERYFTCPAGRGFFTLLAHCRQDSRFAPNSPISDIDSRSSKQAFGSLPSPDVEGITMPPQSLAENHCGTMRGLQGHHNSCYLDATLYGMFSFSSVFDTLLHRQRKEGDIPEYEDVQHVLRESIVNPLRVHGFVRADRILQLRELLDKLSSTAGLVNEEKDPEEFLNSLLQQVLKADPFLHLKSRDVREQDSEGAFFYQIITEKDEAVKVPQVQRLLEQSFLSADIILSEVPSCLILQMPRFGSRYKMYDMILPNLELDITHIVENVPRECTMCGSEVAKFECKMCYQKGIFGDGSGIASYCHGCNTKVHSHRDRVDHKPRPFILPRQCISKGRLLDKQKMDLFAVVCIETSHYVAFVKCGVGVDAPWCFFDSMADRKGEKNGYNIPAVTRCPEALEWLSKEPKEIIAAKERGDIPEKIRRLLGDGYLCMYQNLDMTMYK